VEAIATKEVPHLPDRIGPYQVLKQLSGAGAMPVYLAHEEGPLGVSRDVVLKMASASAGDDARDTKELGREATACAKLNHPGIVRTLHFFEHEGAPVLVLEYVDGVTLKDLLAAPGGRGRRLDDEAAFHVGISILEALAHAHAMTDEQGRGAPIVHRAVSPSNIFIGRDGVVKLGGFGFARTQGGPSDTIGSLTWEPAYMAPEQISQRQLTPKIDVYAAALILWELLTGRPATVLPKDPLAIEGILRAVTQRKPAPLATLRRDLPKELVAAVDAALTFASDKRTITCGELAKWMRKVVSVGQARTLLETRVRAVLAASARAERPVVKAPVAVAASPIASVAVAAPSIAPVAVATPPIAPVAVAAPPSAPVAVAASPIVSIAAAPVIVAAPTPPALPPASSKRERTLLGVAPPSAAAQGPRSLPPIPTAPPARTAQLPPPPVAVALPAMVASPAAALSPVVVESAVVESAVIEPSASPMETPPTQEVIPPIPPPPEYPTMDPVATAVALQRSFVERLTDALNRPSFFENLKQTLQPKSLFRSLKGGLMKGLMRGLKRPLFAESRTEPGQRTSLIERLKAPTPWPRNTWLAAWVALGALLLLLIVGLSGRSSARVADATQNAVLVAPAAASSGVPDPSAPVEEAPAAGESAPAPSAPVPAGEARRDMGTITVHSSASWASVYLIWARQGKVEEPLSIPCGKRFISVGVPAPGRRQPIWLAPGRLMNIPCGGSIEVTINPHALRKASPAFNPTQL
jgi:serine/threonine-protein kinase